MSLVGLPHYAQAQAQTATIEQVKNNFSMCKFGKVTYTDENTVQCQKENHFGGTNKITYTKYASFSEIKLKFTPNSNTLKITNEQLLDYKTAWSLALHNILGTTEEYASQYANKVWGKKLSVSPDGNCKSRNNWSICLPSSKGIQTYNNYLASITYTTE